MKSFLSVLMTTLFVSSAHGYTAGDKRAILMEDIQGTCLHNPACYDAVTTVLADLWATGGGRKLRGLGGKCPRWCVDNQEGVFCQFYDDCRRRELQDAFFSDPATSTTPATDPAATTTTAEASGVDSPEYTEFMHSVEDTCWGDTGVGTDIAITKKVKKALQGTDYDISAMSFRMQVYKCFGV